MTLFLAWIVANVLVGALLLSQARGLAIAAGWLLIALGAVVLTGPIFLVAVVLRRLNLSVAR